VARRQLSRLESLCLPNRRSQPEERREGEREGKREGGREGGREGRKGKRGI
jgi:hypothetical protein